MARFTSTETTKIIRDGEKGGGGGMEVGEEGDYIPIATLRLIQGCRFYGALKRRNDFTVCVDQV